MANCDLLIDKHGGEANTNPCRWPNCYQNGEFKAPVSRTQLKEFHWFCLEHIRIYNSTWNYYEGMSDVEVEASIRSDVTWNRPTWPMGSQMKQEGVFREFTQNFKNISDVFEFVVHDDSRFQRADTSLSPNQRRAITLMGLEVPFLKDEVKARYKILVKRHHPDANGGDKKAEERLKKINEAYETVMDLLLC